MKNVGKFAINDDGVMLAPADYMHEQGDAKLEEILAGKCVSFGLTSHLSPDIETAVLVALQTDYAGWRGTQQLLAQLR